MHRLLVKITFSVLPLFLILLPSLPCAAFLALLFSSWIPFFPLLACILPRVVYIIQTTQLTVPQREGMGVVVGIFMGLWAYGCLGMKRWERRNKCNMSFHETLLSLSFSIPIDSFDPIVCPWFRGRKRVLQVPLLLLTLTATSHCNRGGHHKQSGPVS